MKRCAKIRGEVEGWNDHLLISVRAIHSQPEWIQNNIDTRKPGIDRSKLQQYRQAVRDEARKRRLT